ncbi:ABC transporter ATP-binding protein [Halarsenatibacter silvermanii]|uniref:ATP-binding cassette, subfamily B n=1 Tax=Halarsenatibacter silvermanii TaxID=321763 RepID=A0A1G9H1V7_9FIRM|nr:ABC transporter ATP-binding protein [Halarsenatibacter silvermanii]SDL06543.1 ATP-binding cassette, subfamily B [Halarsenatibacter silvermanii]
MSACEDASSDEGNYDYTYKEMLGRFYRIHLKNYRNDFIKVQFLHIVAAVLLLIPPLIMREIIDEAIPNQNFGRLGMLVGAALVIFIARALVRKHTIYHGHRIAQESVRDMRNDLYQHYQRLSMNFHDRKKTGELMSRIIDDLNKLQEFVHHGPEAVINSLVLIGGTVLIMLYMSVSLTLVTLIFVPALYIFSRLLIQRMHEAFRETREAKADISDRLEDNLAGIKVIKAFVSEREELERFQETTQEHTDKRLNAIKYISLLFPGSRLLNSMGVLIVLGFGGYLTALGTITVGTIVSFYAYLQQFRAPILRMVHMTEDLSRFFASMERYYKHMERTPEIESESVGVPKPPSFEGRVEFEDVNFCYEEEEQVLKGVSFAADPRQTIALVGPSGAGKTTIVRLMPRLYGLDSGSIRIDGSDIRGFSVRELRSAFAMVMQDDYLFSDSVAENIAYGKPGADEDEIIEAARAANAHNFIVNDLPEGYDTQVGQRGLRLSGGQRQRVSIARAFLKNPQILILDEATSSVDLETEKLIQEAIERLTEHRTTFVIAHRLATIVDADEILFVEDGRIKERGSHKELVARGGDYYRFYEMQFEEGSEKTASLS